MTSACARLADLVAAHGAAALVRIAAVQGSTPREVGAAMAVRPDGAFHGTIGGGELEWRALAEARAALADGRGRLRRLDMQLGPDLGQCCGGRAIVTIETFDVRDLDTLRIVAEAAAQGLHLAARLGEDGRVVRSVGADTPIPPRRGGGPREARTGGGKSSVPTALSPPPVGPSDRRPPLRGGVDAPGGDTSSWIEETGPRTTPLLLFGAGHVGRALVLALAPLPFRIRWIDTRADAFPAHVPATTTAVHTDEPGLEIAQAPPGAFA